MKPFRWIQVWIIALALPAFAQVPDTLLHSIHGPAAGELFGFSVGVSGTRIVVGAFKDDAGVAQGGSAYVYDLSSPTPGTPIATLNNPNPAAYDYFGYSVAISGTRVVIGAMRDDTGATDAGSAYVYDLNSATPTVPVLVLNNPSPAVSDEFGWAVGISGTRVVVGSHWDDSAVAHSGRAYVYNVTSPTPNVPIAILSKPSPAYADKFGTSVAISGMSVIVGAPYDDAGGFETGSSYVYDLSSGNPTVPVAMLKSPTPTFGEHFGGSVAISGARIVVGAFWNDTGAENAGIAYVYDLLSGTPTVPIATLNNPDPAAVDQFGTSVSISGTGVVVGTPYDGTGATYAGTAYVYDLGSGTPTVPVATLSNPSPAADDNFGWSVAIDGTTVAIGTPYNDTATSDEGAIYIFAPNAPEIQVRQPSFANIPDGGIKDFGAVAVNGNKSLIFTIKNTGDGDLTGLSITIDGPDSAMFGVTALPVAPVSGPSGSTTFTVQFTPTTAGPKTGALHIANNDTDENPFDITLVGNASAQEVWRQIHFGSIQNIGDGADLNDHDKDGLVNLIEFAFGLNPKKNSPGQLPQGQIIGGNYVIYFNQPSDVSGITYGAEWSTTLLPLSWNPITDTGIAPQHAFSVSIGSSMHLFVRLKVSSP